MIDKQKITTQALTFLQASATGVIGTVSTAGELYTSTVYFTSNDDFSFYFLTSHHSEKFKNLILNPIASFTVGTGPRYEEVMIRGKVQQINEPHERESVTALIAKRVSAPMNEWPIFKVDSLKNGGVALFKLTPTSVQYLNLESVSEEEDYSKYIYQIIP